MTTPAPSPTNEVVNLQAELDDIASYINEYLKFRSKLWAKLYLKKVLQDTFLRPLKLTKLHITDIVSGRTSDFVKSVFGLASGSDKTSEFYDVCSCDYPIHALSLKIASRFPSYEFHKLARLHDYLEKKALRFTAWQVIGFVVAAASFMLKDRKRQSKAMLTSGIGLCGVA